jgi:hypothetical protein
LFINNNPPNKTLPKTRISFNWDDEFPLFKAMALFLNFEAFDGAIFLRHHVL